MYKRERQREVRWKKQKKVKEGVPCDVVFKNAIVVKSESGPCQRCPHNYLAAKLLKLSYGGVKKVNSPTEARGAVFIKSDF